MSQSSEIFLGRGFELFDNSEINEAILLVYKELSHAIRDNAQSIVIDRDKLYFLANDKIIFTTSMIYGESSIYDATRNSLTKIFERDDLVKQYFSIEKADEDGITLNRINLK